MYPCAIASKRQRRHRLERKNGKKREEKKKRQAFMKKMWKIVFDWMNRAWLNLKWAFWICFMWIILNHHPTINRRTSKKKKKILFGLLMRCAEAIFVNQFASGDKLLLPPVADGFCRLMMLLTYTFYPASSRRQVISGLCL